MLSAQGVSSSRRWRYALALVAVLVPLWAAEAQAATGRVLVFHPNPTGNPEVSAGIAAMNDLGRQGDYQVDATQNATAFTGANLARYRAVVFLNTSGNRLNGEQEGALDDYMSRGGGFVGIGTAAEAEPGTVLFNDLIGARPDPASPTGAATQTVVAGDRVHPATRDLPLELNRTDVWYRWQTRPTGTVHTVARWHGLDAPAGDGTTTGGTDHPISWCRDVRGGRSFYTGMGRTAGSYSEQQLRGHLLGGDRVGRRPGARQLQGDHQRQLHGYARRQWRAGRHRPRHQRRVARAGGRPERLGDLHRPRRLPHRRRARRAGRPRRRFRGSSTTPTKTWESAAATCTSGIPRSTTGR